MKGRVVVLGELHGREAAALLVDGRLEDLLIDEQSDLAPGAICRALPERPMKGQGGLFVRLPGGARGFLREARGISPGRPLLVQVAANAEGAKAPPVSTRLVFKSRYAIVTPDAAGLNLSRAIRSPGLRAGLEALAAEGMAGSEMGLILRSACLIAADEDGVLDPEMGAEIAEDIAAMRALAEAVMADLEGGPELLVAAPTPHEAAWRDWAEPAPDAVEEGTMEAHGVPEAVDALLSPRVPLEGGGHMMIEPTRALVAVDVNTGGDTSPAAGLKANIAAVRELPRELRLRGLGGQIVVDFAPMPKRDRAAVEQQMRAVFRRDGSETVLAGWTPLGNYEIQRKRDRRPLRDILAPEAGR
ncbi:ribonuclease E/G [Phaeovulum vinaykumarii]|uniref:Ribonuclease, Rne/Rng family n=1 Tax=Phaeovulum vinaykumarii TaxID=407234 RepID=A0A1N7MIH7_9RHOB|nr:ribonuclease E/G [Phaeovulum vinaykumarii]SIS85729.1 ribonuclease, Rne/Rng family [Phaeovulum vinaykumarii]SOC12343.1 Rne/Rng family ribonuclease [Phaeovulum vinaykumarii]